MEEFVAFETVVYKASVKSIKEGKIDKEILKTLDVVCDKYIEECKATGETSNLHPMLKKLLQLIHPFAPFITEEINELIFKDGSLMDL